ncbi:MAG: PAS domain S-box protein [Euryarchaeota archaeon]|nr:PAS domain S-box protein [Euryarchaeota archaeon]
MRKARILIVEDEAVVAENLEMAIIDSGYDVVGRASSADAAVNAASELKPDLILMDIVLRGQKNGIDASCEIKEKLDIPVIFLTAYSDLKLVDKAKSTEPYAYIVKPFREEQLFAPIEMALYKSQIEKRLKDSEAKFRDLAELLPQTVFETDERGNLAFTNRAGFDCFGYTPDDFEGGLTILQMLSPEDRDRAKENTGKVMRGEHPNDREYLVQRKDGSTFPAIIYSTPIIRENKPVGLRGVLVDITERKRVEGALRESEEKLDSMLRSIGDHISMMDKDLNIIWANETAKKIFGSNIIGKKCYEVYHRRKEPCEPHPCLTLKTFQDGKGHEHDTQVIDQDGNIIHFHCTANAAFKDSGGKPTAVIEISRDITEHIRAEKRIEEEYRRAEFYIDLMSHDINNASQVTSGYLDLLLRMPEFPPGFRKYVEIALNHVRRSSEIISDVKTLSEVQSGETELTRIDIYPAFASAVETTRSQSRDVEINSNITEGSYFIRGNAMLSSVFSNLLTNAVKFDQHEIIKIDVDISPSDDDRYWKFEFKDQGRGIGDPYKKIIFNRLERAGESAQGTGLGLTIVKYIVESYGGSVRVEDRVSGDRTMGSNFIILLPKE